MNHLVKAAALLLVTVTGLGTAQIAMAEVSYNVGFASEYHYRGIKQKNSSASAGIDYEEGGFYAGAWTADVGDGLEIDGYLGYGIEIEDFTASLGLTGYYYTGEFDDTYEEVNLNLGYKIFSLEYSVGEWEGFGAEQDYDFLAATVELENGFYGKYGTFGDDFDGEYVELGYGMTISEIDFGVAVILASDELSDELDSDGQPTEGESLVFTIGKTF
jgi:uncharacterized protein (TIGR02001 family)